MTYCIKSAYSPTSGIDWHVMRRFLYRKCRRKRIPFASGALRLRSHLRHSFDGIEHFVGDQGPSYSVFIPSFQLKSLWNRWNRTLPDVSNIHCSLTGNADLRFDRSLPRPDNPEITSRNRSASTPVSIPIATADLQDDDGIALIQS